MLTKLQAKDMQSLFKKISHISKMCKEETPQRQILEKELLGEIAYLLTNGALFSQTALLQYAIKKLQHSDCYTIPIFLAQYRNQEEQVVTEEIIEELVKEDDIDFFEKFVKQQREAVYKWALPYAFFYRSSKIVRALIEEIPLPYFQISINLDRDAEDYWFLELCRELWQALSLSKKHAMLFHYVSLQNRGKIKKILSMGVDFNYGCSPCVLHRALENNNKEIVQMLLYFGHPYPASVEGVDASIVSFLEQYQTTFSIIQKVKIAEPKSFEKAVELFMQEYSQNTKVFSQGQKANLILQQARAPSGDLKAYIENIKKSLKKGRFLFLLEFICSNIFLPVFRLELELVYKKHERSIVERTKEEIQEFYEAKECVVALRRQEIPTLLWRGLAMEELRILYAKMRMLLTGQFASVYLTPLIVELCIKPQQNLLIKHLDTSFVLIPFVGKRELSLTHLLALIGDKEGLLWLIQHYPERIIDEGETYPIPFYAAMAPHTGVLQLLLDNDYLSQFEKIDEFDQTILMYAARIGNLDAIVWIKQNLPTIFADRYYQKCKAGYNVLHCALMSGRGEIFNFLAGDIRYLDGDVRSSCLPCLQEALKTNQYLCEVVLSRAERDKKDIEYIEAIELQLARNRKAVAQSLSSVSFFKEVSTTATTTTTTTAQEEDWTLL